MIIKIGLNTIQESTISRQINKAKPPLLLTIAD